MNITRISQWILLMTTIIGWFAAMARNDYGFVLIGFSCFALATLYATQAIWRLVNELGNLKADTVVELAEAGLLSCLLVLFGLRVFYVYVEGTELLFLTVCAALMAVYIFIANKTYQAIHTKSRMLSVILLTMHIALILFLLSWVFTPISLLSKSVSAVAMLLALAFLATAMRGQVFELGNKAVTAFHFVRSTKNKTGLLFGFFVITVFYTALVNWKVLPTIENQALPKAYIELIDRVESGIEKDVNGEFPHERYKKKMDKYLERHPVNKGE